MRNLIVIVLFLLVFSGALRPALGEGPCETERIQWGDAFDSLRKAMDDYRSIKNESIAPRIGEVVAKGPKGSMAAAIQAALKNRGDRMAESGRGCQAAVSKERTAYDIWRRCSGAGQQRKNIPSQSGLGAVSRERDRLLADLQDLLLDEAYVQYKGQAAVSANGSEYEPSEQRGASQEDRWMGYRGQAPASSWPGYQGYYR